MAKRNSLKDNACPVARSMEAIGDCWSMLIIRNAMMGQRRFSEFQKDLGLAKNILSARLRALVADGILTTEPASDGSAYQDYVLTPKGRAVFPNMLADRETGRQVRKLELRSADGRLLGAGDTEVKPA
jgi:DNA-binding HxlR family transcriptional regulator